MSQEVTDGGFYFFAFVVIGRRQKLNNISSYNEIEQTLCSFPAADCLSLYYF